MTKVALCTTTINIPYVLDLYRNVGPDVRFFIALDNKTPSDAYLDLPDFFATRGEHWKCSELIGWNSIQRRNIAFLEALKWGADVIVSVDDDNIPTTWDYFQQARMPYLLFSGPMVDHSGEDHHWFDVGRLLHPSVCHRGFPHRIRPRLRITHTVRAKVGVNAGICMGDPDVDAYTRMAVAPEVHNVSRLLEGNGLVVHPHTWTVFNSQNTSILRELVPAWGMWPFVHRMDDIFASLLCQRVMRERNLHVRFGSPFVWQTRNEHNLVKDLRSEIDGYENVQKLADVLDHIPLLGKSVIDDCRTIWRTLNHCDWVPGRTVSAMSAWLDDCESVL